MVRSREGLLSRGHIGVDGTGSGLRVTRSHASGPGVRREICHQACRTQPLIGQWAGRVDGDFT